MSLTFTTKRRLRRLAIAAAAVLTVGILVWLCWVIWLERYIVYSSDGASLNFELQDPGVGNLAAPPSVDETVSIYYNEGENAINTSTELTQITGYYIDAEALQNDLSGTREIIASLKANTAVMMEVKNIKGNFFYSSQLEDAVTSSAVDVVGVDSLIRDMNSRNLYTIASVPAFRDFNYGLNHVSSGLPLPKGYLWMDSQGCYWLNPANSGTLNWLYSIAEELRDLGFDEVVFTDFCFPDTEKIVFKSDKAEAIASAAASLVKTCAKSNFAVSFVTSDMSFKLPEGRTRMYMKNVGAKDVASITAQVTVLDPSVNLVFLSSTSDTRFNDYSVLRPIVTAQDDKNRS